MKGIALKELAYLIVAIILVAILLVLFFVFQFPFMVYPIVMFDHLSTLIRGLVVHGIWTAYQVLIGFFILVIWFSMSDPSCWGPQVVGCAARNAIMTAIVVGFLTWIAFYVTSEIPLVYMPIKLNVSNVTTDENLAGWIMDTSYMSCSGNNDPFAGTSTNPKISFQIYIKKGKFNLKDALYKLDVPTYSVFDKIKGDVWDDERVMINKNWHSDTFNLDIEVSKDSNTGEWDLWVWNDSYNGFCDFEKHVSGGHPWSHPWKLSVDSDLGIIKPQENVFKCGNGKEYNIFVGPSDVNPYRLHVTIGKYSLKYKKLKSVTVRIQDNNGHWDSYKVVYTKFQCACIFNTASVCVYRVCSTSNVINLTQPGLNRYIKKGKTIYLDYLDNCGFCKYYASECGGSLNGEEGVYICIPNR